MFLFVLYIVIQTRQEVKRTGIRKRLEILKILLTYKPSRYIIYNIVTYKISRN